MFMDEDTLREMIGEVTHGRLSRRRFVRTMIGLGLTGPLAMRILTAAGLARAQPRPSRVTPIRRGGGGPVRLLYGAAPPLLNPHLAVAPKDFEASEIFYEPLADIDAEGTIVPVLAAEVPSVDNGGLARDGIWVIWRLKPGVRWHDGQPFTADDVIFTWAYAADPATAATTAGSYRTIACIERLGEHAVQLVFKGPTPF
jgi:peptide/nickel transport system substrate-binding protein